MMTEKEKTKTCIGFWQKDVFIYKDVVNNTPERYKLDNAKPFLAVPKEENDKLKEEIVFLKKRNDYLHRKILKIKRGQK